MVAYISVVKKDGHVYQCLWRKNTLKKKARYISVGEERRPDISVLVEKDDHTYQCLWRKMATYISVCGERWQHIYQCLLRKAATYISVLVEKDDHIITIRIRMRMRMRMKYIAGTFLGYRCNGNMRVAPNPMVFNGLTIIKGYWFFK